MLCLVCCMAHGQIWALLLPVVVVEPGNGAGAETVGLGFSSGVQRNSCFTQLYIMRFLAFGSVT